MNVRFEYPATSAACPQDSRPASNSLAARQILASDSLIESGKAMVISNMRNLLLLTTAHYSVKPTPHGTALDS
jgi:hypothetical protein